MDKNVNFIKKVQSYAYLDLYFSVQVSCYFEKTKCMTRQGLVTPKIMYFWIFLDFWISFASTFACFSDKNIFLESRELSTSFRNFYEYLFCIFTFPNKMVEIIEMVEITK